MKKSSMTAKTLRGILIFSIFLMIGLSATGFYFAQKWLLGLAGTISQTVADSNATDSSNQSLAQLQTALNEQQSIIAKTQVIAAPLSTYQSQAIQDLDRYASDSGITISNYSFTQPAAAATSTTTAAATSSVASKNQIVTATLTSPISYTKLLKFMNYVEGNLPKMQISSVNLGRSSTGSGDSVRIDQLSIEVSIQ